MPRAIDDPLFWHAFSDDRGEVWEVYLATVKGCPALEDLCGICFRDSRMIFINVVESKRVQILTYYHERLHSGCKDLYFVPYNMEERVISKLERPVAKMAEDLGAKLPPYPQGYTALKRKAGRL